MRHRHAVYFSVIAWIGLWAAAGCSGPPKTQSSVECQSDKDCKEGSACRSGVCLRTCQSNADCNKQNQKNNGESSNSKDGNGGDSSERSYTCGLGGVCVVECESDADCPNDEVCHSTGTCWPTSVEVDVCELDQDCSSDKYCGKGSCLKATCESDSDCKGRNICSNGFCRTGCRADDNDASDPTDCPEGFTCTQSNVCERVGCTMGSCGNFQECDTSQDPPSCIYTGNCGGENANSVCQAFADETGEDVPYICNSEQGTCVEKPACQSDDDCSSGEICKQFQNKRNECRVGCRCTDKSDDCTRDCPVGEICSPDNKCVPGCDNAAECARRNGGSKENWACIEREATGESVCARTCQTSDDCPIQGQTCRSNPSASAGQKGRICRPCTKKSHCLAKQICDTTKGVTEEQKNNANVGLCTEAPPACPEDGFGNNHAQKDAYEIQDFPFEETPQFCRNKTEGEWFSLEASDNKVVDIQLDYEQSSGTNLDVALINRQGTELVASALPPTRDEGSERIVYGVNATRQLFVHVRGTIRDENAEYDLNIDVRNPKSCNSGQLEPNDTKDTATKIEKGKQYEDLEVCANLTKEADPDFYKLEAGRDTLVKVRTKAPVARGDINLFLFDEDGNPVARSRTDQKVEKLMYSNQKAQTLTLEVRIETGVGRVQYDLKWTEEPNVCADDLEPNDTCPNEVAELKRDQLTSGKKFGTLNPGQNSSEQPLNVCTDNDFYAVELLPRDTLTTTITYNPIKDEGQLQLTLYGPNSCQRVIESARVESVSNSNKEKLIIDHKTDQGGVFYLSAQIFRAVENVPYEMEVEVDPGAQCKDDDLEPNDSASNATTIERSQVINGGRDAAFLKKRICDRDEDWYCTNLESGDKVEWEVRFDHQEGDINAFVIDPNGTTQASSTSTTSNEVLSYTATTAGQHCVKIAGATPVRNDYALLTKVNGKGTADPVCPDVYEDNDKRSNARALQAGSHPGLSVCGGVLGDPDWYETEVAPGDEITVRAEYPGSRGDVALRLEDADGSRIDRDNFSKPAVVSGTNDASVQQTYAYRVKANGSGTRLYDMTVETTEATSCDDDGREDNDTPGNASALEAPGVATGLKKCESDADWYKLDVPAAQTGQKLKIVLSHDASKADLDAVLYEKTGGGRNKLEESKTSNDQETLTVTPTQSQSGTFLVEVLSKKPARLAYDLITYRDVDGDGTIQTPEEGSGDVECPDPFENNDKRSEATPLTAGQTYSNLLTCGDSPKDRDWYKTEVAPGEKLTVDATRTGSSGDVRLVLQNENGTRLARSNFGQSVTVSATSNREQTLYYRVPPDPSGGRVFYEVTPEITSAQPNCSDDGLEPNDSAAEATPIEAPGLETRLKKCESNDDWFKIDVDSDQTGETIQAFLNHDASRGDLDLVLYEQTGSGPTTQEIDRAETTDDDEQLEWTPSSGTYFVEVVSKRPARVTYDLLTYRDLDESGSFETPKEGVGDKTCPDQFENNDTEAESRGIGARKYENLSMCVDSNGQADPDVYDIFVPLNATLEVTASFTHADGNIDLEVYRGGLSGSPVSSSRSTSDDESISVKESNAGARYFIRVVGDGSDFRNDYTLDVDLSFGGPCPEDRFGTKSTPNHKRQDAHTISSPTDFDMDDSLVLCERTSDWFMFQQSSKSEATFALEHTQSLGAIQLKLVDANGQTIETSTSEMGGNVQIIERTQQNELGAGTYFLKVEADGPSIVRNTYDLWTAFDGQTPDQPYCPDSYERNDEPESQRAASLNLGDGLQMMDAKLCGAEEDWFRASLQGGTTYHVGTYFEHGPNNDLAIEVRDEGGNLVTGDNSGNDISFANDTDTNDETATFTPSSSGMYLFGLKRPTGEMSTTPLFDIQSNSACPEDQYDTGGSSNDQERNIATLPNGSGVYALGSCGSNLQPNDWYKVEVQSAGHFRVRVYYNGDTVTPATSSSTVKYVPSSGPTLSYDFNTSTNRLTWDSKTDLVAPGGGTLPVKKGDTFHIKVTTRSSGSGAYFLEIID